MLPGLFTFSSIWFMQMICIYTISRNHIGKWVDPFAAAVKEKSRQQWYVFISEELKKTVHEDGVRLE
jgi:hypothetical protein